MSIILDEDGRGICTSCGRNKVLVIGQCQLCNQYFPLKEITSFEEWMQDVIVLRNDVDPA